MSTLKNYSSKIIFQISNQNNVFLLSSTIIYFCYYVSYVSLFICMYIRMPIEKNYKNILLTNLLNKFKKLKNIFDNLKKIL